MTVFVHMGAHKTGTTLLQNLLKANRQALEAQGVFYLRGPGRHPFWYYWQDGDKVAFRERRAKFRRQFLRGARDHGHVIFSSETMFGTSDLTGAACLYPKATETLRALARALRGLEVRIVFYVRRQDDFIEATFLNRIQTLATSEHLDHAALLRNRSWRDFGAYMGEFDMAGLSWLDLATRFADVFGRAALIFRPFESIAGDSAAYARRFMGDFCDPEGLDLTPPVFENRSFSAPALAAFLQEAPGQPYESLKDLRLALQARFPNTEYPRPDLLTRDQRQVILETHAASNQHLFKDWMAPEDQVFDYSKIRL